MKQLPINTEPYMRAYTQYAYIDMILNNSVRTGEELTKLELSEPLDTDWIFDFKDAEVSIKDSSISVKQNWQVKSDVKFFYRKMKKKEEIVLRITDLEYTNEWDSLGFFIDDSLDNFAEYPKMIYTLGSYCGPYVHQLYKDRNKLVAAKHDMKEYPFYLKISIENNVLKDFISYDGTVWEQIDCIENFVDVEKEHLMMCASTVSTILMWR